MFESREAMLANLPFPAPEGSANYGMLFGHKFALDAYRASTINWCVLTPPSSIEGYTRTGKVILDRTGKYRTSTTALVKDANGASRINLADLAVAVVDEVKLRRFAKRRFTVGY